MMLLQENKQPMEDHACSEGYQSICITAMVKRRYTKSGAVMVLSRSPSR